jgi:hypothetical protein
MRVLTAMGAALFGATAALAQASLDDFAALETA